MPPSTSSAISRGWVFARRKIAIVCLLLLAVSTATVWVVTPLAIEEVPFASALFVLPCAGWFGFLIILLVPNLLLSRFLERARVFTLQSRYDRFQERLRAVYPELRQLDTRPFVSALAHEWLTGRKGSPVRLRIGVEDAEDPAGVLALRVGVGPFSDETRREVEELAGLVDRHLLPDAADRARMDRMEDEWMDQVLVTSGINRDD